MALSIIRSHALSILHAFSRESGNRLTDRVCKLCLISSSWSSSVALCFPHCLRLFFHSSIVLPEKSPGFSETAFQVGVNLVSRPLCQAGRGKLKLYPSHLQTLRFALFPASSYGAGREERPLKGSSARRCHCHQHPRQCNFGHAFFMQPPERELRNIPLRVKVR